MLAGFFLVVLCALSCALWAAAGHYSNMSCQNHLHTPTIRHIVDYFNGICKIGRARSQERASSCCLTSRFSSRRVGGKYNIGCQGLYVFYVKLRIQMCTSSGICWAMRCWSAIWLCCFRNDIFIQISFTIFHKSRRTVDEPLVSLVLSDLSWNFLFLFDVFKIFFASNMNIQLV